MRIKTIIALLLFLSSIGTGIFGAYEFNIDRSKDFVETQGKISKTERLSMQKTENKQSFNIGDKAIHIAETNTYYYLKVKYSYTVGETEHEGSFVDSFQTKDEKILEDHKTREFPEGKAQKLFYRIDNPSISVLEVNKNFSTEAFIVTGILLFITLITYFSY